MRSKRRKAPKLLRSHSFLLWATAAVVGSLVSCGGQKLTEVPEELIGIWTTTATEYDGRSLELRSKYVVIGTGDGSADADPVVEVVVNRTAGTTAYTIVSSDREGDDFNLHLVYDTAQRVLYLKNRPRAKWTKQGGVGSRGVQAP